MITVNNIDQFKKSYNDAVSEGKEVFIFEGGEVLTSYAKYVIQYIDSILN